MAALDDYGPFDGQSKNEDFWRDFFRHLTGSAVIDGVGSEFAVTERGAGPNLSVDVASGECFIRGHWGESTSTKNVAISTGHATLARIDRVVLRADFTANTVSVEVLEGTPNASPTVPALTQSAARWEIPLAQIAVPALDTAIGNAQITDERTIIAHPLVDYSTAPSDGDTLVFDSTTGLWEPEAPDSGASVVVVRKTADESVTSNTTVQDDDHLTFPVAASEVWAFRIYVSVLSVAGSTHLKMTVAGPSGSTVLWAIDGANTWTTGSAGGINRTLAGGATLSVYTDNVATVYVLAGVIVNGATPGSCRLQWAQDTTNASALTVKTNSHLIATKGA